MTNEQSELQKSEQERKHFQAAHYAEAAAELPVIGRDAAIVKHGICAVLAAEGRHGSEAARGFVSDSRFDRGNDRVIPRTDRSKTKKMWRP